MSGLFLSRLLQGASVRQALEHTASAYQVRFIVSEYALPTRALKSNVGLVQRAWEPDSCSCHLLQAVMQATHDAGEYELQTVAAQDEIAAPSRWFKATPL